MAASNVLLTAEERRFIADTLRNVLFDLREDDEDKWAGLLPEVEEALALVEQPLDADEDFDEYGETDGGGGGADRSNNDAS